MKLTYRKSGAGNLLMLGPLLQCQMRKAKLKVLLTCLLLVLEVCNVKPTYRKSWVRNLLMWSDLTLSPSFKVKRWFTGFGELFFQWIQIYIFSPMRRSSFFPSTSLSYFSYIASTDNSVSYF